MLDHIMNNLTVDGDVQLIHLIIFFGDGVRSRRSSETKAPNARWSMEVALSAMVEISRIGIGVPSSARRAAPWQFPWHNRRCVPVQLLLPT
jgi:hypothetical protein